MYNVEYFFNCGTRLETIYSHKLLRLLTIVQEKEEGGGVVVKEVKEAAMERLIPARPASCNSCESEIINVGIIRKKSWNYQKKVGISGNYQAANHVSRKYLHANLQCLIRS